jgi:hypothetical protein
MLLPANAVITRDFAQQNIAVNQFVMFLNHISINILSKRCVDKEYTITVLLFLYTAFIIFIRIEIIQNLDSALHNTIQGR